MNTIYKHTTYYTLFLLLILSTFFYSCNKNNPARSELKTEKTETEKPALTLPDTVSNTENSQEATESAIFAEKFNRAIIAPEAHKKYLTDPLVFQPIDDAGISTGRTAVVGSEVCCFYPDADLSTNEDLENLPEGIPLPIGTLLVIEEEAVTNRKDDYYGLPAFHFQDNYNYFYRTVWQGKKGLVFGADLRGIDAELSKNKITAHLYRTQGVPSAFHPITGYAELPVNIQKKLEKDRLVFQEVKKTEYCLSAYTPDDMISLYTAHRYSSSDKAPLFITTDLMAHTKHIVFDKLLQSIEENLFLPKLHTLNTLFLEALQKVNTDNNPTAQPETLEKALLYFQTAEALMALGAVRVEQEDEYGRPEIIYKEPDAQTVLAHYPEAVQNEIATMNDAAGFDYSSVFHFADGNAVKEDYSQYKPRGHYTKNGALSAYFKTMMWFGRIHFLIAAPGPEILKANLSAGTPEQSHTLIEQMEAVALLITEIVHRNPQLYKKWTALFDPITALIGASDDLSFKELLPLWESFSVQDFSTWSSKPENLEAFMLAAHKKLKPPAISGSSVFYAPSEGTGQLSADGSTVDRKPPMGWRLFGQRFTLDSYLHGLVSSPRLYGRTSVKGLDIMTAFGSKTADSLLRSDYETFPKMKKILTAAAQSVNTEPENFFGNTYYGSVLKEIALQAQFEQGAGFYFTESPTWNTKALLSAHGTWAELRHDTILYVKQNYAELGGGGDVELTVRTKQVPLPVHYIEPNIRFWKNTATSIDALINVLNPYQLIDEDYMTALQELKKIAEKALKISILEWNDQPVSAEDLLWISKIPSYLGRIILPGYSSIVDEDALRMALVADVFTNAESGIVLETAVGIPYRMYVPLNDRQGGKRIAIGYCFNYYEFEQPISGRLNNEQWKQAVYQDYEKNETDGDSTFAPETLETLKPFWAQNISLPPKKMAE